MSVFPTCVSSQSCLSQRWMALEIWCPLKQQKYLVKFRCVKWLHAALLSVFSALKHWSSGGAYSSHLPARWHIIWFFCALLCSPGQCLPPLRMVLRSNGDKSIWEMSLTVLISSVRFLLNYMLWLLFEYSISLSYLHSLQHTIFDPSTFCQVFLPFHTALMLTWKAPKIRKSLHLFSSGAHCTEGGYFTASPAQPRKPWTDVASHEKVWNKHADKFLHVLLH